MMTVALFFFYCNLSRVHQAIRVTPAMESGTSDHIWSIDEMCSLFPTAPSTTKQIDKALILEALGE